MVKLMAILGRRSSRGTLIRGNVCVRGGEAPLDKGGRELVVFIELAYPNSRIKEDIYEVDKEVGNQHGGRRH